MSVISPTFVLTESLLPRDMSVMMSHSHPHLQMLVRPMCTGATMLERSISYSEGKDCVY